MLNVTNRGFCFQLVSQGEGTTSLINAAISFFLAPVEVHVIPFVLAINEPVEKAFSSYLLAFFKGDEHTVVCLRCTETVNARYTCHDDHVVPFKKRIRGQEPEPVDLFIDRGIFFYIGVCLRQIGLGLIVIVIADKEVDLILGKRVLNSA